MNRRDFLKVSAITGTGLVIGFNLSGQRRADAEPYPFAVLEGDLEPDALLRIAADGTITIFVPRSELGQGVNTALPMILAEELEVDLSMVHIEHALADPSRYGDQTTGGSTSIQSNYMKLRMVGGAARTMLTMAAAQSWGVDIAECYAEQGMIIHRPSGKKLAYRELVAAASKLPVPGIRKVRLKDAKDYRIIGKAHAPVDSPHFVDGSAEFTSDLVLPGMLYAVVARCPTFGGKATGFDDSKTKAVPGVTQVVQISTGVAVVAASTWAALQGRQALQVTWDHGKAAQLTSESLAQKRADTLQKMVDTSKKDNPNVDKYIEAYYDSPYLAHAKMEPVTCVADARADVCEVWAPTQDRQQALSIAQSTAHAKTVIVHVPLVGGAFGRGLYVDYVPEAIEISEAVGKPVKVFWTRQDDLQHDFYRPASRHFLQAGLDKSGMPITWTHKIAGQTTGDITAGAYIPYQLDKDVKGAGILEAIPIGYWRSVANPPNAYANECFMDEIAAASGKDPYELRMQLLPDSSRLKPVLKLAAEKAGWGTPLPKGSGRGIACHATWGVTYVAEVVEVTVDADGDVHVQRVVCAVDCGLAINPDGVAAQMEGGIVFGITAALKGEITFKDGQAQQQSFREVSMLRFDEMPKVEVYLVAGSDDPSGTGEMGNPPATPALLNAIFAATGKRIRKLPIKPGDLAQS